MIKSEDLRTGNYVNDYKCDPYKIKTISDTLRFYRKWVNGCFIENVYPIPLTEEILLKCGFEKTYRIGFGELQPCYANLSFGLMIRCNSLFYDYIGGRIEIKYLHQLQNLFYSLYGKELNVEL